MEKKIKVRRRTKTTNSDGSKTVVVRRRDGSTKKVKTTAKDGEMFRTYDDGKGVKGYSKYKTKYRRDGSIKKTKETSIDGLGTYTNTIKSNNNGNIRTTKRYKRR